MQFTVDYSGWQDRQSKVAENESMGLRMLHDNFGSDWKRGDEPHGTMIFTDEPSLVDTTPEPRDLEVEIDELRARIQSLETR